ncbi:phosphopentomutase [Lentilactobacillus sp. SPB1-3]|uniref:Phosphopentomutase n=1 Tax=Lentilactobacillus terminaliae TaxID=3003483 RepID=A0ACD5DE36_9LACO|nr:phosphopentomutase [Lentilactobacillus sp. SPB1-3]MCZ0977645.1 phosphopentomutase [Lentilactobacillus sp. SPB1-3]
MKIKRVIILDLASMGIGESADANRFDSVGADTLGHLLADDSTQITVPALTELGLGNIRYQNPISQIPIVDNPFGSYGKIQIAAPNNQVNSGLREMLDYQAEERTTSILDSVVEVNAVENTVLVLANYQSYLSNQLRAQNVHVNDDTSVWWALHREAISPRPGLIYARMSTLDQLAHQGKKEEYRNELEMIDQNIQRVMNEMYSTDLLLITSSFANDMQSPLTVTREYLPLIAYNPGGQPGKSLGIRRSLGDIGATVAELFNVQVADNNIGHSFLRELL